MNTGIIWNIKRDIIEKSPIMKLRSLLEWVKSPLYYGSCVEIYVKAWYYLPTPPLGQDMTQG